MLDEKEILKFEIKNAENLHGHLGPFLVIGVKMARLAKKTLNVDEDKPWEMQAMAELPLITPFSCVLDGIQSAAKCTVGNRKLEIKNSDKGVAAIFRLKSLGKAVKIQVKRQVIETLREQLSKGVPNEELAWKIAAMPESQLFKVENG